MPQITTKNAVLEQLLDAAAPSQFSWLAAEGVGIIKSLRKSWEAEGASTLAKIAWIVIVRGLESDEEHPNSAECRALVIAHLLPGLLDCAPLSIT